MSSACCQHVDNVCMHAPIRAFLMWVVGLYMCSWKKKKQFVFIIVFYYSETCLARKILNTHKRALRRYNRGDAPILSKCSLTESSLLFSVVLCCLARLWESISSLHLGYPAASVCLLKEGRKYLFSTSWQYSALP